MEGFEQAHDTAADASTSTYKGTMADDSNSKRAVLHLQPSVRQTVVKTITTTTIHYAPIELPHPDSPKLAGDYAQDRHSLPLPLAEEKRRAALLRAGRSGNDDDEQEDAFYERSTKDLRRFQLEFGRRGSSEHEPIKAVYTLDKEASDFADTTLPAAGTSDRKGKGKARVDHASSYTDEEADTATHAQAELKRKRRPSADQSTLNAAQAEPSFTLSNNLRHSLLSDNEDPPPRKKTRNTSGPFPDLPVEARTPDASGGLGTPTTPSAGLEEPAIHSESVIPLPSYKGKGRATPSDIVLPSPTLSPRLHPDELDDTGPRDEEDAQIEQQLVPHSNSNNPESPSRRELVRHTQTEQVVEEDERTRSDEQQLACLSEGYTLSTLMSLPSLVTKYSTLSEKLQLNILYQLLRQSSTPVIQRVNQIIQPALKRDFISDLPAELSLQVLSYLTCSSSTIMNCLLVSKNWKRFIDSQGQIWSDLLKSDDLWIGGRNTGTTEESDNAACFVENEEAAYWNSVGVTKGAFANSRSARSAAGRRRTTITGSAITRGKRRKSHSKSTSRERAASDGQYHGSSEEAKELDVKDMLSINDWRSALFLKRWKERTWDESFDMEEAARPTAEKLAALNNIQHRADSSDGGNSAPRSASRLRRANTRPRIEEQAARTGLVSPPSAAQSLPAEVDYIHPLKLIYKKRVAVRSHWFSREPAETSVHRTTFRGAQTSVITNLQFDNEKIVTASDDPSIDVYDTMTGEMKMRLEGHDGGVWALQYVGNVLVSGSTDRTVRVWDLETGNCTHVFYGHTSTVRCLQIVEPVNVNPDPNGTPVWEPPYPLIVTGSRDWTLRVWRLPYPTRTSSLLPYCPPSPSDEVHDPANNAYHLRVLRGHGLAVRALAAHGRTVVSGSYDSYLRVWDLLSGECKHKLVGHSAKVYSVALDTARNRCASGSMDGSVRIWSLETGESLFRLDGHSSLVGLLGCSYHFLVSAGADSTLKVWDPNTGTCIDTLSANAGAITCFKHDDFRIVSGCEGQLRVWDIRGGQVVKDVVQNMQGVWQLQFSDRFAVAAVSRDGRTDFEILDFFPELREERPPWAEYDHYDEAFESMDEDVQDAYEEYGSVGGPIGTDEDDASSTLPHYEVSSSQASMFQTPRQADASSASRQPPARKHVDARFYSYPEGQPKQVHHHHHQLRRPHHHHHHHGHTQATGSTRGSRNSMRAGPSPVARNLSNAGSAISSVIVGDPENVDDLFAYDAGDGAGPSGTSYAHQTEAGPSTAPETAHQSQLSVGAALAHLANAGVEADDDIHVKSETPEVKAEEEDVDYAPL